MADSSADRQRRSRRHRAGDHSFCVPGRCPAVTPDVTEEPRDAEPEQGPKLGSAGRRLWRDVVEAGKPRPLQAVLLLEACRIADRLDKLDAQLRGEDWLRFDPNDDGTGVTVVVDKVLSEARQQATALKQIVGELRQAGGQVKASARARAAAASGKQVKGASGVADISARIAAKRAASTS